VGGYFRGEESQVAIGYLEGISYFGDSQEDYERE